MEQCTTHFVDVLNFDSIRAVYEWAKGEVSRIGFLLRFFKINLFFTELSGDDEAH